MWRTASGLHVPATLRVARCTGVQGRILLNLWSAIMALQLIAHAPAALLGSEDVFISSIAQAARWAPKTPASPECAARWGALLASRNWLTVMCAVGALLLFCSWFTLLYAANHLRATAASPADAGRQRFIAASTFIIENCATQGKLLLHPVIPWLLMSHSLFKLRCMDPHQGRVELVVSTVLPIIYLSAVRVFAW